MRLHPYPYDPIPRDARRGARCGWLPALLVFVLALAGCVERSHSADEYLRRAQEAQVQGDLRTALIEVKNALQQDPERVEARRLLGMLQLESGDPVGAESELGRAIELGDTSAETQVALARARLMQGNFERVLELPGETAGLAASDAAAMRALRGQALLGLGRIEQARDALETALSLDETHAEAQLGMAWVELMEGQRDPALARVRSLLDRYPAFDRGWELLGDLEREAGHLEAAEAAYSQAAEVGSTPFAPIYKRILTRMDRNDLEGASQDIAALRERYRPNPAIRFAEGLLAFHQQRHADARADFEDVLSADPDHVLAAYYLGAVHHALGNRHQAETHLSRVVARYPSFTAAARLLAQAQLQDGDAIRSEATLKAALANHPDDRATLAMLGGLYLDQGRTADALLQLRAMAALDPDDAQLRARIGLLHLQRGEHDAATRELEGALDLTPAELTQLEVAMVVQHFQTGAYDRALEAIESLQARELLNAATYYNLIALARLGLGDVDSAVAAFRDGLEAVPGNVALSMNLGTLELQRGNREEAIQVFESLQTRNPGHPDSAIRLASLALDDGDTVRAHRWLGPALQRHPDVAELHFQMARTLVASQAHEESEQALFRTLELDPDHVLARVILTRRLAFTGRVDEARELFEPLAARHGERADVLAQQGWFQLHDGRFEEAIESYRQALAGQARRNWVMEAHRAHVGAGDHDGAAATLMTWLEREPADTGARRLLASTYLHAGREEDAITVYEDQLQRQVRDVVALNNLAWLLRHRDHPRAVELARAAYELAPERAEVLDTLGTLQRLGGEPVEAVDTLRRARELAPEAPGIGLNLAEALAAAARPEEARAILLELLDRHPEFPERQRATELLGRLSSGTITPGEGA